MPKHNTVALAVKLTVEHSACNVCGQDSGSIVYSIYEVMSDGKEWEQGGIYCVACAAKHGHQKALVASLSVSEAELLRADAEDGTPDDEAETKAEMAHLRGLIAAGKLTAPPIIPKECFARMAS